MNFQFSCISCGECCRVDGYVYLNSKEVKAMAALLGMKEKDFKKQHTDWMPIIGHTLKTPKEGGCIFLKAGKCTVYGARPAQCRAFPYWKDIMKDEGEMERVAGYCKGITITIKD